MLDGNSAALRKHEVDTDRWERKLDMASVYRGELVKDFIESQESKTMECLADVAVTDAEFLHALQRGDSVRMMKLLRDYVDYTYGDELVAEKAREM